MNDSESQRPPFSELNWVTPYPLSPCTPLQRIVWMTVSLCPLFCMHDWVTPFLDVTLLQRLIWLTRETGGSQVPLRTNENLSLICCRDDCCHVQHEYRGDVLLAALQQAMASSSQFLLLLVQESREISPLLTLESLLLDVQFFLSFKHRRGFLALHLCAIWYRI